MPMTLNLSATKWSRSTGMSILLQKKTDAASTTTLKQFRWAKTWEMRDKQLAPFSEMETEAKVISFKLEHPAHFKDHQGHYKNNN